jgi:hypothetical protein
VWKENSSDQLVGTWDAPRQQLQWWMGKRPLQTVVTEVPADPLSGRPNSTTFYPRRDDAIRKAFDQVQATAPFSQDLSGSRLDPSCDWEGEKEHTVKELYGGFAENQQLQGLGWEANIHASEEQPDARSGQVYFVYNTSGLCGGKVWLPEGVTIHPNNTWSWDLHGDLLGMLPKRARLSTVEQYQGLLIYGGDGDLPTLSYPDPPLNATQYHRCSVDQVGSSEADNLAARDLLSSMLLPGGSDITWQLGSCNHQSGDVSDYYGAWKLLRQPGEEGFGPNTVFLDGDGRYPAPVPDEPDDQGNPVAWANYYTLYAYDYHFDGDAYVGKYFIDPVRPFFRDIHNSQYSMQHVRLGFFDKQTTYQEAFRAGYYWGPFPNADLSGDLSSLDSPWYGVSWCPSNTTTPAPRVVEGAQPETPLIQPGGLPGWVEGVTCTLSITPMQADVFRNLDVCAASLPQGIPHITCRSANGTLLEMPPDVIGSFTEYRSQIRTHQEYPDPEVGDGSYEWGQRTASGRVELTRPSSRSPPAAAIVAGVEFIISPQRDAADAHKTLGPSGKLPDVACNKQAYSPRFGGRCAAPVVQYLAYDEAYHRPENRAQHGLPEYGGCLAGGLMRSLSSSNLTTWQQFHSWWTPPLWPADAWFNLHTTLGNNMAATSAFLDDQKSLNSLFVYQKEFKLPIDRSPAGECG